MTLSPGLLSAWCASIAKTCSLSLTHHHAKLATSLLNPCRMVNSTWFSSIVTWKADLWIWLTLAPDPLFHAESRKKSFWESPSLTFMGNLLAHLVFFSLLRLKHRLLFLIFPYPAPPIPQTSHGCFGKSLIMGSSSILCLANCPMGSHPLHFLESVGVAVWYDGVFFQQNALFPDSF